MPDVDAKLLKAREAYLTALDKGNLDAADLAYIRLDNLLELRLHLPAQRS